jgi:hypothetical protein
MSTKIQFNLFSIQSSFMSEGRKIRIKGQDHKIEEKNILKEIFDSILVEMSRGVDVRGTFRTSKKADFEKKPTSKKSRLPKKRTSKMTNLKK